LRQTRNGKGSEGRRCDEHRTESRFHDFSLDAAVRGIFADAKCAALCMIQSNAFLYRRRRACQFCYP
jgi:hypothetical protein